MKINLGEFIKRLKSHEIIFTSKNFDEINFSFSIKMILSIVTPIFDYNRTHNDGKRGLQGGTRTENNLYEILKTFDDRKIKFALSK